MNAAGAYLRRLRDAQGLTQGRLGELVGVAGNTIYRIEAGKQEPQGKQLAALLSVLHGRIEHFQQLFNSAVATTKDAEDLAAKALSVRRLIELADTDEKRRGLLIRIVQLTDDPVLAARIEGYLDRLETEQG